MTECMLISSSYGVNHGKLRNEKKKSKERKSTGTFLTEKCNSTSLFLLLYGIQVN